MNFGLPLVGRDAELARLRHRIDAAAAGQGGLVLLGGEAGVGKSALLATALHEAEQTLVLPCRCPGPGETPPFGPWLEALQQLVRRTGCDLAVLPPPFGQAPARESGYDLASVMLDWVVQQGRPLLVAIEDLHWADHASLDLLRHLSGRLTAVPLLIIATYRSEELHGGHPLWPLLPDLQRAGAERLLVPRLTSAPLSELVTAALGPLPAASDLAELLYRRTGGLPLFVRELLEAAARSGQIPQEGDPLPETVQQALDSKLIRLPSAAHEALAAAAVIGEQFDYELLARVVELSEDDLVSALEEAIGLHLIRPEGMGGDRFAFAHALVRELLLSRLIGLRRRRWHARVAAAHAATPQPDTDALALHLSRAGDPRALDALLAAGDRALRLGALAQAAQRYEEALALVAAADPRRSELLLRLGWCVRYTDPDRAATYWQEAATAAESAGDRPVQVWAGHVALVSAVVQNGPKLEYLPQVNAIQAAQTELLSDARYQKLDTLLYGQPAGYPRMGPYGAVILTLQGELAKAEQLLQELATHAQAGASAEFALAQFYLACFAGRLTDAVQLARRGVAAALAAKNYYGALARLYDCLYFYLLGQADHPDEADAIAAEATRLEAEAHRAWGYGYLPAGFSLVGFHQYLRGDWPTAWHNVVECARHVLLPTIHWQAATMLWETGDLVGALAAAERLHPTRPGDPLPWHLVQVWPHALRAHLHVERGEVQHARAWLDAAERWPAGRVSKLHRPALRLAWAAYHRSVGNAAAAWEAACQALAAAEEVPLPWWIIKSHRLLGELAAELGRPEEAAEHLQAAQDLATRCRMPFEAALTRLARGRLLAGAPDRRADLEAARDTFAALGAARLLAEAEALLGRATGEAVAVPASHPADEGSRPGGLTEREVEVVTLVAQGQTDREVAARLFLSPRTVDRHLRNIFGKLGVTNRAALAAYAARHGLVR